MVAALDDGVAKDGYRGAMRAGTALLDARSRVTDIPPVFAARWGVRAEDPDGALALARASARSSRTEFALYQHGAVLGPVRGDPRFVGLLRA